ncbi:hypothetical protein P4N68_02160 [Corynebacterium felinum]|uniref:Uncharacterized protein n=1 Tax=Corynebacterium felinum TaxID=131318 RepID=A0ABU2BC98_9CORY|nr:hypothetical protein [Corynebacterium felinum]MDF5819886.1 hypothetical protein [Corynebacterium felinum]MDR7355971.1 hypothetical protein [Corynebacterium felinum]WJY95307.1 hypothetical protein CFELI_08510 [Corynebacterium felinum]
MRTTNPRTSQTIETKTTRRFDTGTELSYPLWGKFTGIEFGAVPFILGYIYYMLVGNGDKAVSQVVPITVLIAFNSTFWLSYYFKRKTGELTNGQCGVLLITPFLTGAAGFWGLCALANIV